MSSAPTFLDDLSAQQLSESAAIFGVSTASTLTYAALCELSEAGARSLVAAAGSSDSPGSPVLDFVDEGVPMVLAILSILKSGSVCVPADPATPRLRLCALVDDLDARVALCLGAAIGSLLSRGGWRDGPSSPQLLSIEAIIGPAAPAPAPSLHQPTARCLCHLVYTSGSTGRPKAVAVEHSALRAYAQERVRAHGIDRSSRVMLTSAHTWDPAIGDVASALCAGATLCLAARADIVHDLGRVLAAAEATHVGATPSLWAMLELAPSALPALRVVALGGEPMPLSLAQPWVRAAPSLALLNTYGVTEACVFQTAGRVVSLESAGWEGGAPAAGGPLPTVRLGLLPCAEAEAEGGGPCEVGEIVLGGVQLARGYHRRPELTADRFVQLRDADVRPLPPSADGGDDNGGGGGGDSIRWFRTGDLGRWDARAAGLRVLGRLDAQVKLRGIRLELGEVESLARSSAAVCAAAAIVRSGALLLYVVPSPDAATFSARGGEVAVRLKLRRGLPASLQPLQVVPLPALPLSSGGKLLRSELPPPPPPPRGQHDARGLRGPIEELVAATWAAVLRVEAVGPYDNWFTLGGTSIEATRMLRMLGPALGPLLHCGADPGSGPSEPDATDSGACGSGVDAYLRGSQPKNQRFATRLCGLYRKPLLRDYCLWLEWAALPAPTSSTDGLGAFASQHTLGAAEADASALAAGDVALPESEDLRSYATEALGHAAAVGSVLLVRELLAEGASADGMVSRRERGVTPLMRAAGRGPASSPAEASAERKRASSPPDGWESSLEAQQPPRHQPVPRDEASHDAVVRLLLAAGASVNQSSHTQATALHLAAGAGRLDALKELLDAGAAVHARDLNKWSALYHAAFAGSAGCTAEILRRGGCARAADRWGRTPLCWAADGGHAGVVAALLAAGARPDGEKKPQAAHLERHNDNVWMPPLHLAIRQGGGRVVRMLLDSRADPRRRDQHGRTPWDVARAAGCDESLALLREAGGEATPALVAAAQPRPELVTAAAPSARRCPVAYASAQPRPDAKAHSAKAHSRPWPPLAPPFALVPSRATACDRAWPPRVFVP